MSLSNYVENKILDHVFRNTAYTPAATVYVALNSADPGETGANELASVYGYSRQSVAFGAAASGAMSNSGQVVFTNTGTGAEDWATATHFSLWDASSGGNCLGVGSLAASKTIKAGDTGTFAIGDLDITLD